MQYSRTAYDAKSSLETRYQTTFEIRRVLLTVFVVTWKLFFSLSTSVHSALGASRLCAIQMYYWHWYWHFTGIQMHSPAYSVAHDIKIGLYKTHINQSTTLLNHRVVLYKKIKVITKLKSWRWRSEIRRVREASLLGGVTGLLYGLVVDWLMWV